MERLQKVIAESGVCSRRRAEELILEGRVSVNGEKVTELGTKVSTDDVILVNGKSLPNVKKEYYLLNKPRGVICSVEDPEGRKTIVSLIDTNARIYPVGRLDYDTTGLILLTNDGELTNILTHPSCEVPKTYVAKIKGLLTGEEIYALKTGIEIEGRKCKPLRLKSKKSNHEKDASYVELTIVEGRNHIVKRLFEAIHHDVLKLTRTHYAFLDLGTLQSGEYRMLSIKEVKQLYSYSKKK